mmetsp:Transcript_20572/g.52742  ORF Transcript_20572/g.52742 Transcript_20572/m.52742 type:complete len:221 (-) Transcript_20572:175-837(-)
MATLGCTAMRVGLPRKPAGAQAHRAVPGRRLPSGTHRALQQPPRLLKAVAMDAAPETEIPTSSPMQIRELLVAELGWRPTWVDGIIDEAKKGKLVTNVAVAREAAAELANFGLSVSEMENVASRAPAVLATSGAQLRAVIDYLRSRGLSIEEARRQVVTYPRILLYAVSADGATLGFQQARMEVDVTGSDDSRRIVVSQWREGAAFETAPVSPWRPVAQR